MSIDPAPGAPDSTRFRLSVPDLALRPSFDAGCCSFPAEELICESLAAVPGLRAVGCDPARGELRVDLDLDSDPLPRLRTVLEDLGYSVTEVRR